MTETSRCILGVFAHPDDETTAAAGTFTRYAPEGVDVYVATATRGEQGSLGSADTQIRREDLPGVREEELRAVLQLYGAHPPILLGYKDQELASADREELASAVLSVMRDVAPDAVITFGPSGISSHEDHIAIHHATVDAFHRYSAGRVPAARLLYVAIPKDVADRFELELHELETSPTTAIDISDHKATKIRALRMHQSQTDAQELADMFESNPFDAEYFHQAYPPYAGHGLSPSLWDEGELG